MHNACRLGLSVGRKLTAFDTALRDINRFIGSLPQKDINDVDVLLRFTSLGELPAVAFVLLATQLRNPKVQVYVICSVQGCETAGEFRREPCPPFPFVLEMLSTSCRVASPRSEASSREVLLHETLDDLAQRLVHENDEWQVARLEYDMATEWDSLLHFRVSGERVGFIAANIGGKRGKRVVNEDAYLSWLRLPKHSPFVGSAGNDAEGHGSGPSGSIDARSTSRVELFRALASMGADEITQQVAEDCLRAAEVDEVNFDEMYADVVGGVVAHEEACDDEGDDVIVGCASDEDGEERAGSDVGGGDGGLEGPMLDDETEAVALAVEVAVEDSGGASSSSSGPAVPPSVPPLVALPEIEISGLGYVTCRRPPHTGNVIGLVSWKGDGKSIFAGCHIHPQCSVSCGIMRFDVSREYMAEWLAAGEPCPSTLPMAVKLRMRDAHRALWRRPAGPA
ncbi:unnamed protein product [Polarella glacialis]|uniref:Uncharacterized protein n=2 Tax=Polarella glacialis TaxID=89957 RepID=A0A813D6Z9_POLGL|nr:unnamed protein product [Polarella glacialis]